MRARWADMAGAAAMDGVITGDLQTINPHGHAGSDPVGGSDPYALQHAHRQTHTGVGRRHRHGNARDSDSWNLLAFW